MRHRIKFNKEKALKVAREPNMTIKHLALEAGIPINVAQEIMKEVRNDAKERRKSKTTRNV